MPEPLDDFGAQFYKKYALGNQYGLETGVFALPIAVNEDDLGPDESPVVFVKAHAAFRTRTVQWAAEKEGSPPLMPKPADSGSCRFLGGEIAFTSPSLNTNGRTFTWSAAGLYTFIESVPNPNCDFVLGTTMPFRTTRQAELAEAFADRVTPGEGAIADAGKDATIAYAESGDVDLSSAYAYDSISYVGSVWFHPGLLSGDVPIADTAPGGNQGLYS